MLRSGPPPRQRGDLGGRQLLRRLYVSERSVASAAVRGDADMAGSGVSVTTRSRSAPGAAPRACRSQ
jgi:hypothetical protein